jgi:hypothetical protein
LGEKQVSIREESTGRVFELPHLNVTPI